MSGEDDAGDTPLHYICSDQESVDHALKCIPLMVRHLCNVCVCVCACVGVCICVCACVGMCICVCILYCVYVYGFPAA